MELSHAPLQRLNKTRKGKGDASPGTPFAATMKLTRRAEVGTLDLKFHRGTLEGICSGQLILDTTIPDRNETSVALL